MIYCGVDIIEISRIKESIEKFENSFIDKVYELSWKDVEILNSKTGRPYVKFVEENLKDKLSPEIIDRLKNAQIDITLSHNKSQAIAYVVVNI